MPFISGIGPGEIIIILIIALIVVGPGKLPDVGSALGKSIREFRKAATDVKESTSLDAPVSAAPAAPPPAQVAAPATPVVTTPEPSEAVPVGTTVPPAPPAVPAAPAAAPAAAPDAPAAAETAENEVAGTAAEAAPASGEWPAEVTPVDEQQPTASA